MHQQWPREGTTSQPLPPVQPVALQPLPPQGNQCHQTKTLLQYRLFQARQYSVTFDQHVDMLNSKQ